MDRIAVLLPCYNEAATIGKVVRDFARALPEAVIYVYDNNSTDGTGDIARAAGAVVRQEPRQGKGNVIRSMFRQIDALCYVMADGDDTYPADHARQMADLVLSGQADMVIGDRLSSTYFTENTRRFHGGGNLLVRDMVNRIFGGDLKDIMTGYRAFSPEFVKSFPILSRGFEIETEMSIHALDNQMKVCSLPVDFRERPEGSVSKLNTFRDGAKVLLTIFRLFRDYRPLAFFGLGAGVISLAAVILLVPVFAEYFSTGLVPRFPTLFFGCFLLLTAVCLLIGGLVLSTQRVHYRRQSEIERNIISLLLRDKEERARAETAEEGK